MRTKRYFFIAMCGYFLAGCGGMPMTKAVHLNHSGKNGALSNTAKTRTVHIVNKDTSYQFCSEPAPDVAESGESNFTLKFSFLNFFQDVEDEDKDFEEDTDIPLIGRTGYLLLAREFGYRLCEAQVGMGMTGKDYVEMHKLNTDLLIKISKEEGIGSSYKFATKQDVGEEFQRDTNVKTKYESDAKAKPNDEFKDLFLKKLKEKQGGSASIPVGSAPGNSLPNINNLSESTTP